MKSIGKVNMDNLDNMENIFDKIIRPPCPD
jgi:hypothetical protein